jgi:hypothetical protein
MTLSGGDRREWVAFRLPQQFSLNCCCATPRRSKHEELLRQIRLFSLFAAVVKSPDWRFSQKVDVKLQNFMTEGNACGTQIYMTKECRVAIYFR